jgi:hypothetical protein
MLAIEKVLIYPGKPGGGAGYGATTAAELPVAPSHDGTEDVKA